MTEPVAEKIDTNYAPQKPNLLQKTKAKITQWTSFLFFVAAISGLFGYFFLFDLNKAVKNFAPQKLEFAAKLTKNTEPTAFAPDSGADFHTQELELGSPAPIAETPPPAQPIAPTYAELAPQDKALLAHLLQQHSVLTSLYALDQIEKELSVTRPNTTKLQASLTFLEKAQLNTTSYQAKLDILTYAFDANLPNQNQLLLELEQLVAATDSNKTLSIWEVVKKEFFGLIKITKLEQSSTNVEGNIALAKLDIEQQNLAAAIEKIALIVPAATDKNSALIAARNKWLEQAKKLALVHETINFLRENFQNDLLKNGEK